VRASDRIGLEREPQKPTTGPGSGYGSSELLIREVSRHSLALIHGHVENVMLGVLSPRTPGAWRGQVPMATDFNAEDAEIIALFEGSGRR
jgi:hypothetical protein